MSDRPCQTTIMICDCGTTELITYCRISSDKHPTQTNSTVCSHY